MSENEIQHSLNFSTGPIPSQIIETPEPVLKIPGRSSKAKYELVFKLDQLPGMSIENVRITVKHPKNHAELNEKNSSKQTNKSMDIEIENSVVNY